MRVNFWIRTEKDGDRVNGHIHRSRALAYYLVSMGYNVALNMEDPLYPIQGGIHIFDGMWPWGGNWDNQNYFDFTAVIDDYYYYSSDVKIDLLINPSFYNPERGSAGAIVKESIGGMRNAALVDRIVIEKEVVPFVEKYDVIVVPGGHTDKFLERFYGYADKISEFVTVAQGMEKERFIDELADAALVICTPSTTAIEAALLGTPIMLIITDEDQYGIHNQLAENNAAVLLNDENIERMKDPIFRIDLIRNAYQCVNPYSTYSVALKLHQLIQRKLS